MNHDVRQIDNQTAPPQAEGELCLTGASRAKVSLNLRQISTRSQVHITGFYFVRTARLRHNPEAENNSIPIDPGPAQFNAFYPQCSGQDFVSFPEHFTPEHCG